METALEERGETPSHLADRGCNPELQPCRLKQKRSFSNHLESGKIVLFSFDFRLYLPLPLLLFISPLFFSVFLQFYFFTHFCHYIYLFPCSLFYFSVFLVLILLQRTDEFHPLLGHLHSTGTTPSINTLNIQLLTYLRS
jgi:hypothetical protein